MQPLTLRTFGLALLLVIACALTALAGCGGTSEPADLAGSVTAPDSGRASIQPVDCGGGISCR